MIEFGTGANKTKVECLTLHDEQEIELRLRRKGKNEPRRSIMLWEPSAIEYARLRKAALAADKSIEEAFPRPDPPPDRLPDESDLERAVRMAEYQKMLGDWMDDRHNFRTDEDHAPYANVMIVIVKTLSTESVTLEDLTAEAFKPAPLQALMEVWETPLGGAVSPVAEETPTVSDATSPLDSPESTPSSRPGGTPSPPSPPPSSTE